MIVPKTLGLLLVLALVTSSCALPELHAIPESPSPDGLPDTNAQQALVHQYIADLAAGRYADAWPLLTPQRQDREALKQFAAQWRQRGTVSPQVDGVFVWPAAIGEVRAQVWLPQANGSGGLQTIIFRLAQSQGAWRVDDELIVGQRQDGAPSSLPASPEALARQSIAAAYGSLYLATFRVLDDEPFDGGRLIVFSFLNPLVYPKTSGPQPTAMLRFVRPENGGWVGAGGGTIGTPAGNGEEAVSCAWTWIHLTGWAPKNLPEMAAFYCTVGNPQVGAIEIERVDGGIQRVRANGREAVVFPYPWDSQKHGWPAQHPQAIRLFDTSGQPLQLSVCCTMGSGRAFSHRDEHAITSGRDRIRIMCWNQWTIDVVRREMRDVSAHDADRPNPESARGGQECSRG